MRGCSALALLLLALVVATPASADSIGWGELSFPHTMTYELGSPAPSPIFGQAYMDGVTTVPSPDAGLVAQLGYGQTSAPTAWTEWTPAVFWTAVGHDRHEFVASFTPACSGTYYYTYRFSYNGGGFTYVDLDGILDSTPNLGVLIVTGGSCTAVPEPATLALFGLGAAGLAVHRRRRAKHNA